MIKYRKLKNLLIWKCKQKKVGSQLPAATRMAELEEVEPPVPLVLLPCTSCNRTFRPEALAKHAKVCEKSLMKKRKKFDSAKQRLQGTDVPVFPPPPKSKESPLKPLQQSKWREKQAEITKNLNSGRKKSEQTGGLLIKPSDHERCLYCDRYFGPKAYDRHTEWCKEQHIKLKNNNNLNNEARERLQVRTKYRAPLSNRVLTRDKYLPRSRDPSPMSASRIEAEDPVKQKLPSPLNRTSSLRLSNRSKSMITKSPSVPKIELKEGIMRKNQSSTSVRQIDTSLNNVEKHLMSHDTGVTQPKILSGRLSQKKVTESFSNDSRKRRSWTSPANLDGIFASQSEQLQVYSCLLQPKKRLNDCSHSDTDGKKMSTSVSKSVDVLPSTFTVDKKLLEKGSSPTHFKVVDDVVDVTYDIEGDETSEMISDEILRLTDSWRLLPVVLFNPSEAYNSPSADDLSPNILAVKLKSDSTPEYLDEQSEVSVESNLSETSDTDLLFPWESNFINSPNNFMSWLENPIDQRLEDHTMELDSDTNSLHNCHLSSYESLFADFQDFVETKSESCSFNYPLPTNFVKMYKIVEVNDVGTTVDDLQQHVDNWSVSSKVFKCDSLDLEAKLAYSPSATVLGSPKCSLLKHQSEEQLKHSNDHSPLVDSEKYTLRPNSIYVVSSTGSLKTFNECQINILDSDDESLASFPFPFFDIFQNKNNTINCQADCLIDFHSEEVLSTNFNQKVQDLKPMESLEKITYVDKATSVDSNFVLEVSSSLKKSSVDHKNVLRFRDVSSRSELVQVDLPCRVCAASREQPYNSRKRTVDEKYLSHFNGGSDLMNRKHSCKLKRFLHSVSKSDDNSSWSFSTTSLSSWSLTRKCGGKRTKRFLKKKKTIKYYETIGSQVKENGVTLIEARVHDSFPQKMTVEKNLVKPLFNENAYISSERKPELRGSCEYLKLPPIKQRFANPRDVVKYDPFASAEQQMLELFGGVSQKQPAEKKTPQTPTNDTAPLESESSSPHSTSPTSAFAVFTPKSKRSSSQESLKLDNKENNNFESDVTPSPPPNDQMNNNHKNFSLSNLSLCSIISIDSIDCNKNPISVKTFKPQDEPLQRSMSASEGKSGRNRVKVNMQQMLYGFDSPDVPLSPSRSADVGNLEACEAELILSMMEFEKMLNSSPLPNLETPPSPGTPPSKHQDNFHSLKRDDDHQQNSKSTVPLSIDSAYGSLTRASGDGDVVNVEPSKFCHECGAKYPVPMAKFCCNCGIRRLTM